jgi:hypothetical protein
MLRESCEVPTCDDPRREKAEDGCTGGIGWQGVADCVPCGRLECAMLGMGRGARLACAHRVAGSGGLCALWQAGVCHAGHGEGSTAGLRARRTEAKVRFFGN